MKKSRIILAASAGILAIASAFATKSSTRFNPSGFVQESASSCVAKIANCASGSQNAFTSSNCKTGKVIFTQQSSDGTTCLGNQLQVTYPPTK
jgi:hypothetical protein